MHFESYFLWTCLLCSLSLARAFPVEQDDVMLDMDEMELTEEQLEYLKGNTRNVKLWSGYYWPNRTLVYSIGDGLTAADVTRITQAMSAISSRTCVRFRRAHNSREPQVVIHRNGTGCSSTIGYQERQQRMHLGTGCMRSGIIQHEILHSLAFVHMQGDPHRNRFVKINRENILAGKEQEFDIYSPLDVGDFGLGYDYGSIMHYGTHTFSKNGRPTITTLQSGAKIGQRDGLSPKDILKIKRMYCP